MVSKSKTWTMLGCRNPATTRASHLERPRELLHRLHRLAAGHAFDDRCATKRLESLRALRRVQLRQPHGECRARLPRLRAIGDVERGVSLARALLLCELCLKAALLEPDALPLEVEPRVALLLLLGEPLLREGHLLLASCVTLRALVHALDLAGLRSLAGS